MNSIQKGMIEKFLSQFPKDQHASLEPEFEYAVGLMNDSKTPNDLIRVLMFELAVARANLQKRRNFIRSMGTVYSAKGVDFPEKFGTAKDFINDITLDMFWFEHTQNIGVLCAASNKYFVMDWENIARIAVRNGVANVDEEV